MFEAAVVKRPSPKQMSRLRNGHKVRLAPAIEGEGMQLLIDPSKLNQITKTFGKGKGMMVQLSPEEISANREIGGEGIFGKKFDRLLKKGGIKKAVFDVAAAAKPVVKEAMKQGLKSVPPKYKPLAESAAAMTSAYMDDPEKFQSAKGAAQLAKVGAVAGAKGAISQQMKGMKQGETKPVAGKGMRRRTAVMPVGAGLGMGLGAGLYAGARGSGITNVGGRSPLLSVPNAGLPPALQSQNASANFHFSTQLPPALASMKIGGAGLYL
jgi:hypothetical protein